MLNYYLKRSSIGMILLFCCVCLANAADTNIENLANEFVKLAIKPELTVVDEFGKPLSGVKILSKSGELLGVTNSEGEFDVSAHVTGLEIVLVHENYLPIEHTAKQGLIVRMETSYLKKNEELPILYDIKKSKEILGSVSSVYTRQISSTPTSLYLNALTGRLPGLYTQETSGFRTAKIAPVSVIDLAGSLPNDATKYSSNISDNSEIGFNLRGQQPVVMIDGVQRDIFSLDPESIESVTVLKDALSTLLLGQRSSRGVLQVVTKRGVAGPPKISFTAQTGFQNALKTPKPLSSYEYAYLYNEALRNDNRPQAYTAEDFKAFREGSSPLFHPDVNWYNTVLRNDAPISKYNLNVNGGLKNARYSMSLSYFNQEGLFQESSSNSYDTNLGLSRYLINSSVDVDITSNLTLGLQLFGRIEDGRQPGAGTKSVLEQLYSTPNNVYPIFNSDGSYGGASNYPTNLYQQTVGSGYLLDNNRDLMSNLDLKYKLDDFLEGLYFKTKVNVSSTSSSIINRSKRQLVYDLSLNSAGDTIYTKYGSISDQPNSFDMTSTAQFFYVQAALGYDRSVDHHHWGAMLFADQQTSTYQYDLPGKYTNIAVTGNYNFKEKYFAEAALNYSGFNRYAPGHQFGLFYAAGLGWEIANESFIKDDAKWINQLKLRATYGATGNINEGALGYFTWRNSFGQDGTNNYPAGVGYASVFGLVEKGLANFNATWEKAHKFNAGLDFAFFNNHFIGTFDFYRDVYSDLLQQRGSTIELIGLSYPNENIGKNLYMGQELSLTYRNNIKNFNYFITANASRMKTEVLYMNELIQQFSWNKRTGMSVGQTFGYLTDGLIQTQEEADAAPLLGGTKVYPGDIKLVDLNNDGVIDQFDQTALGNTKPIIYFGANLGFAFKGFDFSVLLQGVKNRTYQQTDYSFGSGGQAQGYDYLLGRWTPETGQTATYPRLTVGANANNNPYLNNSNFWTHSGEYLRLKNIDLGYTLPYRLTSNFKISGLRVFANAQNLFTTTAYDRLDPEIYGNNSYPTQKIINMGVNIKF